MKDQVQFREKLSGIVALAEEEGKRISTNEVEKYFEEDALSTEQMELVYDFLLAQKIVVKGYEKKGGTVKPREKETLLLTKEEEDYLKLYLSDLSMIKPEDRGEKERLFQQAKAGEAFAKSRLIELHLSQVVAIAKEMNHPDVFLGDLIQEGNVSLMLALDELTEMTNIESVLKEEIKEGMQALIEEYKEDKVQDQKIVEQVSELDTHIQNLAEDLGRKVSIDELAEHMGMTDEEVLGVLKLAGEDIDIEEPENYDNLNE
ncbi:MAG: sigma-70 domain-containing protein [Lachnospiraceae bacterium]